MFEISSKHKRNKSDHPELVANASPTKLFSDGGFLKKRSGDATFSDGKLNLVPLYTEAATSFDEEARRNVIVGLRNTSFYVAAGQEKNVSIQPGK